MEIKPIIISFKQSEKWISDYAKKHNSPSAWIKDLIVLDYEEKKKLSSGFNGFGQTTTNTSLFDD